MNDWDGKTERRGDIPLVLQELHEVKACQQEMQASMVRMEERFAAHMTTDEQSDLEFRRMLIEHHNTLYGNGKAGLDKDVDRLKQQSRTVGWFLATAWVAILGGLVKVLTGK